MDTESDPTLLERYEVLRGERHHCVISLLCTTQSVDSPWRSRYIRDLAGVMNLSILDSGSGKRAHEGKLGTAWRVRSGGELA